jgi:hypothetical protein
MPLLRTVKNVTFQDKKILFFAESYSLTHTLPGLAIDSSPVTAASSIRDTSYEGIWQAIEKTPDTCAGRARDRTDY